MFKRLLLLAAVLLAPPVMPSAWAQAPAPGFERPIRIIVPIAPGGGTDVFARLLGEIVGTSLGQPIVVENRPGASSTIGTQFVAEQRADGTTLLFTANSPITAAPHVMNTRYTLDQLDPMFIVGHTGFTLCVRQDSPIMTAQALIAAMRAAPGRFTYGTDGVGGNMHLAAERVFRALGLEATMVPFQGAAQTLASFTGGHIDLYGGSIAVAMPAIRDGRARCLILTQRAQHPEVPTGSGLDVLGIPNEETLIWWGMIAPRGIAAERRAALMTAFEAAWRTERFQTQLARSGVTPEFRDSAASTALITAENEALARVVRQIGIERSR
ncbi:tripartite tricarboxylate transporter substrate binding protein [Sediminicoccus sp. KRV36]|uniref:tripartite tricarboxylate transporter substrate binding protein n=1 Tax=Sediminicoccus sp. KRV36 TaxID=3133721 RepID=UPI00200BDF11|nr:tripartite tricarboxylate transporter substrate binding protein [Sediminicoccus rosea]UPY39145.1 tripartite tricarboxylate transporter substrate binding protein [Sediminicoccus rosea]